MRGNSMFFIFPVLVILVSFQISNAQGPVQLSLINSIQIVPENESVTAFRLAIYGKNTHTQYVDIGIVTQNTNGKSQGIQLSFVGLQDDFTGWQAATAFNYSPGNVKGLMTGAVNYSGHMNGLQIGIVNYTETAYGIQLGLLNIIKKGGMLPFFPLFNFSL
jgi:predicted transcriptional regulator with HTH domain